MTEIQTNRLFLRNFTLADAPPSVYQYAKNPKVGAHRWLATTSKCG
ncbi:hypothetical protein [Lentilactobacillus senioris]|nr:hypothetical protein [Lentilactobacillus senioris]